ncbi:prephenate dehydratase [Williamsia herbipolensis]|uniref:Prephenate dehydratase n=1 Tax=Williamsia herbipolensis TaxID=1603258 RepID=A0AAU4JXA7_9NOCA|nr:prephenate dehydratase [Williamsia herbipolensis]
MSDRRPLPPEPSGAVAYFGPAGTFTEMALDRLMDRVGWAVRERSAQSSPGDVVGAVRSGALEYGCVPMESSVEGAVPATMDALAAGDGVQILAETVLDIAFTVAAVPGRGRDDVQTIAAYPVAEGQTRESLRRLFPSATVVPSSSNAAAAADVAAGRADAALTTALAADNHGLVALAEDVADAADATTRFVLIGRPAPVPARTGRDRTAVILNLPDVPGSLVRAMSEFATRDIDLMRIESRPRRHSPGYHFFLDASGHIDDPLMGHALAGLHAFAEKVTFLGSWAAERATGAASPDHSDSLRWVEALRRGEH